MNHFQQIYCPKREDREFPPNKATQSDIGCGTVMAKATAVWSAGPRPELLGDKIVSSPICQTNPASRVKWASW